jgi:hypothetical protein
MKKIVLVVVILGSLVSGLFGAGIVKGYGNTNFTKAYIVSNHFYEFDKSENSKGYYWCGHTAYKVAIEASLKGREVFPLKNLHNLFKNDYYYKNHLNCGDYQQYGKKYCASFQNLEEANQYYRFYNASDSYPYNYSNMFFQIKKSINKGNPVITPWPYKYEGGHFWVIIGYLDHKDNSKDKIYLRDVADSTPGKYYEIGVHPLTFWRAGYSKGETSMHLMFMKTN